MAIKKAYEFSCDMCSGGGLFYGNKSELIKEKRYELYGWVFAYGKHFCSEDCKTNYDKHQQANG